MPKVLDARPVETAEVLADRRRFELGIHPQSRRRNEHGDYVLPSIQDRWSGWQACTLDKGSRAVSTPKVEPAPSPDLCDFYSVKDYPSLVKELVKHVSQLIDASRRNVKPWEDTFPPTLLPSYIHNVAMDDGQPDTFQDRVNVWMHQCFGVAIAHDKTERVHRFLEEAIELAQAGRCSHQEAMSLVDYVYGRPVGVLEQEVGGVGVTLAALCSAYGVPLQEAMETELRRVFQPDVMARVANKQKTKPQFSALPGTSYPEREKYHGQPSE